jgi:hypothetical protein
MPDEPRQDPPKQDDPNDQGQQPPAPPQSGQQQQNPPANAGDAGDQGDDNADGRDAGASLEDQLEAEKRKNVQLSRQLTQAKNEKTKADSDRDAAKERDDFKTENTKLKGMLESRFLIWAIATDKKHQWQDAEDVVKFIKDDEINIDVDTEAIEGLDLALKRIAKDKPYLLVPANDGQPPAGGQPSGNHPSGSKSGDRVTETKRLGEKYRIPGFTTQGQKFM